jgi:biotin carboxyl carrier protein
LHYRVLIDGEEFELEVDRSGAGTTVVHDGRAKRVDVLRIADSSVYSLILGGTSHEVSVHRRNGEFEVVLGGETYAARVFDERAMKIAAAGGEADGAQAGEIIRAPMPGVVIGIAVAVGEEISPGQGVVTLEAMKMENELKSASGGTVKEIRVEIGRGVSQGEPLVVIE